MSPASDEDLGRPVFTRARLALLVMICALVCVAIFITSKGMIFVNSVEEIMLKELEEANATLFAINADKPSGAGPAPSSASSKAEDLLDFVSDACGDCLRKAGLPVLRSALALGFTVDLPALHKHEFYTYYIATEDATAKLLFQAGHAAMLWPLQELHRLPFVDLGIDVVLLNSTLLKTVKEAELVFAGVARLLQPAGMLVLTAPLKEALDPSKLKPIFQLLQPSKWSNVYHKSEAESATLPECQDCSMNNPEFDGTCQPRIQKHFVPLSKRVDEILADKPLGMGRLHKWPIGNVLGTQQHPSWCDSTRNTQKGWFESNYVNGAPTKAEWKQDFEQKIMRGEITSILDAGAGGCTLEGYLRRQGFLDKLQPFMAFGAYDCSMLRICAERSSISFQWNWLDPLPVCQDCKFDLVFQAEGVHHLSPDNWDKSWDSLSEHLKCNGYLYLNDHPCVAKETHEVKQPDGSTVKWCWVDSAKAWAQAKGHQVQQGNGVGVEVYIQKLCPETTAPPPAKEGQKPAQPPAAQSAEGAVLDVVSDACGNCLRESVLPVHRSALAIGFEKPLPALHEHDFYAYYVHHEEAFAKVLFQAGHGSMWWRQLTEVLPFGDFAFDVVLVNTVACFNETTKESMLATVLNDASRMLQPSGFLVLTKSLDAEKLAFTDLTPRAQNLLVPTKFSNVYSRVDYNQGSWRPDLPFCKEHCWDKDPTCQPYHQTWFQSVNNSERSKNILGENNLQIARLHKWQVGNVLGTFEGQDAWSDRTWNDPAQKQWFIVNYMTPDPNKREWHPEFDEWIKSGRVKSLLDAGAGTCTLEGYLRRVGQMPKLKPFMAFGAYDCSMLKLCAERSSISFQWNWLDKLPVCDDCMFDMVFQAEGVHHLGQDQWVPSWERLSEHLNCGGILYLTDHHCDANNGEIHKVEKNGQMVDGCWYDSAEDWAKAKGWPVRSFKPIHDVVDLLIDKVCPEQTGGRRLAR